MLKFTGYGVAAAIALGAFTMTAQAAPATSTGELKASAGSAVEKAARRCWWHNGHRHCRRVDSDRRYYGPSYGYGPGVNLYIGRDRKHHGHRY